MKIFKQVLNFVILNGLIFILISMFFSFYVKNNSLSLLLSLFCTFIISSLAHKLSTKKLIATQKKIQDKKQLNIFLGQICSLEKAEQENIIAHALKNNITKENDFIIYNKNIYVENVLSSQLTKQKIIVACKNAKKLKKENVLIFCLKSPPQETNYAKSITNFKVEICEATEVFSLLKKANFQFEDEIVSNKKSRLTFSTFIELLLNKKNAKKYFIFGILMLFFSYFTILRLYYFIFSIAFFSLGLICLFKKKSKTTQSFIN